jgi:hypothetical protein
MKAIWKETTWLAQEVNISLTLRYIWQDDRGKRRLDEQGAFPALNMPTP